MPYDRSRHADTRCGPTTSAPTPTYGGRRSWFGALIQACRGNREPGVRPGLPRSGEWERPPSSALGRPRGAWEATASRGRAESGTTRPRVRRPASAPRPPGAVVRGRVGRPTARTTLRWTSAVPPSSSSRPGPSGPISRGERRDGHRDSPPSAAHSMQVRKRNGDTEPVDVNKIVRAVERCAGDLTDVDPMRVATRTISGLYDGATTAELDRLSIQTAAEMIGEEPQYSRLAARLLAGYIDKEVRSQGVASFSQSVALGHAEGLIGDETARVRRGQRPQARRRDRRRRRPPVRVLRAAHRLRPLPAAAPDDPPGRRDPAVLPAAGGLRAGRRRPGEAIALLPADVARWPTCRARPTLFNSGTRHTQMSSCYLVDSPARRAGLDLRRATPRWPSCRSSPAASASSCSRVRSRGALIRGTNGQSNGIVPFLRTLDASVAAVNQGGRRKGAACVYLEPWHPDIEEFLELRDNTGEDARRTHNLNLANWIPDEFMRRVEADADWSLFDPDRGPRAARPVGRRVRRRLPAAPRPRAATCGRSRPASCTAG